MEIELIGVPFDGYGRPGNQASAPAALRGSGLSEAVGALRTIHTDVDLDLPHRAPSGASTPA